MARQKRTLILLDDEPGLCRDLQAVVSPENLTVVKATSLDEAVSLARGPEVSLFVHGTHSSETHWKTCSHLTKEFPHLPSLHVEMPESRMIHEHPRNRLNASIQYLAPKVQFLRKIRRLVGFQEVAREKSLHGSFMERLTLLDSRLDSLDSNAVASGFIEYLGDQLGASNVFWLADGDIDYYLNELWKVQAIMGMDPVVPKPRDIISWKGSDAPTLSRIIHSADRLLPEGWRGSRFQVKGNLSGMGFGSFLVLPLVDRKRLWGHYLVINPSRPGENEFLNYWFSRVARAYSRAEQYREARRLTYIDDVTELYNQRFLSVVLDREISRAQRMQKKFSLLFIDIDHFKAVNDSRGHLVGSKLLQEMSKILKQNIRGNDYGFRYGGDEFILLLSDTNSKEARAAGERVRRQVERTPFAVGGTELQLTLSIGIASFPDHARTREEIIKLADEAMYHAKHRSRNVVYVSGS